MIDISFLKQLSDTFGPSGFEEEVVELIKQKCPGMECRTDGMNNLLVKPGDFIGNKPVLMLDAHTDEIGFMVQHIKSNGLIEFVQLGSWMTSCLPAHSVLIRNYRGEYIKGVIHSKPPHFSDDNGESMLQNLTIDVGASSYDEVTNTLGISAGDPAVPECSLIYNDKLGIIRGKALDDRIGCFVAIEVLKRIASIDNLAIDVVGAFSAQEETDYRGAKVNAKNASPDLAVVLEAPPADDVYLDSFAAQAVLKKGVQIRHIDNRAISSPKFLRFGIKTAEQNDIAYQRAVRKKGSTDAAVIHIADKAIPCLVLGVPTRYTHTHFSYSSVQDIESAIDLVTAVVKSLQPEIIAELTR